MLKNSFIKILFTLFAATSAFSATNLYKADINADDIVKFQKDGAVVVDIRTKPEWIDLGIVPDSKMITFFEEDGKYDLDEFISKLYDYDLYEDSKIIIICRSGNRSVEASNMLSQKGYKNIYNVKKGIKGWIIKRYPIQKVNEGF